MGFRIDKVIADKMLMAIEEDNPVEIMQAEETRKEESAPPEWKWDPSIEIVVVPGRRIISNHGWTFLIIITVNYRWIRVALWLGVRVLARGSGS